MINAEAKLQAVRVFLEQLEKEIQEARALLKAAPKTT